MLQQYGANFVSIQSYNSTDTVSGSSRKLFRKLLSHQLADRPGSYHGRHLAQANSNASLAVNMLVTVPADQQLQVLSPGTSEKVSQSLAASGNSLLPCKSSQCICSECICQTIAALVLLFLTVVMTSCSLLLLQITYPLHSSLVQALRKSRPVSSVERAPSK